MNKKIENLSIDEIWINRHDVCPNGVLGINWSANIGWGELVLRLGDDGLLHAYTEHMDKGEDKSFTRTVLLELLNYIVIDG